MTITDWDEAGYEEEDVEGLEDKDEDDEDEPEENTCVECHGGTRRGALCAGCVDDVRRIALELERHTANAVAKYNTTIGFAETVRTLVKGDDMPNLAATLRAVLSGYDKAMMEVVK